MSDDFTKVWMILDKDYAHYKLHACSKCGNKCNKDRAEINDELNKKYSDTISSDEVSVRSERPAELIGSEEEQDTNEAIHELNNPGVPEQVLLSKQRDATIPFVNGEKNLSNNAESKALYTSYIKITLSYVHHRGFYGAVK